MSYEPQRHRRAAQTVAEFCEDNRISRALLYQLWNEGKGPRFIRLGPQKIVITAEASAAWRAEREAESNPATAA
jgi:hypothetical protein